MLVRREPIVATVYRRDSYRREVITIPQRTLLWNDLFEFSCDWAIIRTHREDQEFEDVFNLIEYMSDFLQPPPLVRKRLVLYMMFKFPISLFFYIDVILVYEYYS